MRLRGYYPLILSATFTIKCATLSWKRAVVLATGREIQLDDLSPAIREERFAPPETEQSGKTSGEKYSLKDRVTSLEIQMIRDAMAQTDGDRRRAARILGLSHQGLINKLKRYGLET